MFDAIESVHVTLYLDGYDLNDHVMNTIQSQVSNVVEMFSDSVTLDLGGKDEFNLNRVATSMLRVQNLIDFWYDATDFVLTCPDCNKFTDLDDWAEASAKRLTEETLEDMVSENVVCPHCRNKMTLNSVLYEANEEIEPWEVNK